MKAVLVVFCASLCLFAVQGTALAAPVSICDANTKNLIGNCGFETGDFTSWSLSGNDVPATLGNLYGVEGIDPFDGLSPNSGSSQTFFADLVANATTISQNIATNVNDIYEISWFLAQDTAPGSQPTESNLFAAAFGVTQLTELMAIPVQGYTQYSFFAIANAVSTSLSFTLGNDLGQFLLDDVVVTDLGTPEPSTWLLLVMAGAATGLYRTRKAFSRSR